MQDVCVKISSVRLLCAKFLYADLLCLSLCQDLCIRILYDHLCKISVCRSLVQDLCVRIFASGSCEIFCAKSLYENLFRGVRTISSAESCKSAWARSVYEDFLCQMSVSRPPAGPVIPLAQDRTSCAKSLYEDLLRKALKISPAESCKSARARSVYEDLLCKLSVSRFPQ